MSTPIDIANLVADRSDTALVTPLRRDGDACVIQGFTDGHPDGPALWAKTDFPARRATTAEMRRAFPDGEPTQALRDLVA